MKKRVWMGVGGCGLWLGCLLVTTSHYSDAPQWLLVGPGWLLHSTGLILLALMLADPGLEPASLDREEWRDVLWGMSPLALLCSVAMLEIVPDPMDMEVGPSLWHALLKSVLIVGSWWVALGLIVLGPVGLLIAARYGKGPLESIRQSYGVVLEGYRGVVAAQFVGGAIRGGGMVLVWTLLDKRSWLGVMGMSLTWALGHGVTLYILSVVERLARTAKLKQQ